MELEGVLSRAFENYTPAPVSFRLPPDRDVIVGYTRVVYCDIISGKEVASNEPDGQLRCAAARLDLLAVLLEDYAMELRKKARELNQ